MRSLWWLFLVGLATGKLFVSSQSSSVTDDLYIEDQSSGDLPIDDEDGEDGGSGSGSGDYAFSKLPDEEEILQRFLNFSREVVSVQPQPTAGSPHNPPTTVAPSQDAATTVKDTKRTRFIFPDGKVPGIGSTTEWFTNKASPSSTSMPLSESTSADYKLDKEGRSLDTRRSDVILKTEVEHVAKAGQGSKLHEKSPPVVSSENLWERTDVLAAVIACGVVGFLCAVFLLLLLAYRMKKKDEGSYDLGDTKLSATAYHKAPTKEFFA